MLKVLARNAQKKTGLLTDTALRKGLLAAGTALLGFVLVQAVIMGELYPFGISFLAALCGIQVLLARFAFLGVLAGTFFAVDGKLLIPYLLSSCLVFFLLARYQKRETHWLVIPALVLAINLLSRGVFNYLQGNDIYLWVGIMFESFFAGVLTLISIIGLQALPRLRRRELLNAEERTSLGVLLIGSLAGVGNFSVIGLSVQSILSRCLVLAAGLLGGPGAGAAAGVAVGLIPSIQGTLTANPIAFYALAGLLGGVFNSFGKAGVIVGFSLANLLLSLFFAEEAVLVQSFWETGLAVLLFLLLSLFKFQTALYPAETVPAPGPDPYSLINEKLQKVSQVFGELEKAFRAAGAQRETKELNVNTLFDQVASQVCDGCSLRKVCWEQDFYKTYRALLEVCAKLERAGAVTERDFSPELKRRCVRLRELNLTLNAQMELQRVHAGYQRQLENATQLINYQLKGLAQLIQSYAAELRTEVMNDGELAAYLKDKLGEKGIQVKRIDVTLRKDGEKELTLYQDACPEKNWCKAMVAPNISQILGKTYIIKDLSCGPRGQCHYTVVPSPAYRVLVGTAQCPKEGGKVSGDVCSTVELPDNRTLLLISDGMGTGEEALNESQTALSLLEKLLLSGFSMETALKTVNAALFLRSGQEKFATLDIAIINRVNGQTDFIKLGGAPSLLCSAQGIKVIKGATPPAGILESVEPQNIRQVLNADNLLIMMSDGVWEAVQDAGGPAGWLEDVLKNLDYSEPQKIAGHLLFLAKKATGNRARDDMCVQVAWLSEVNIA